MPFLGASESEDESESEEEEPSEELEPSLELSSSVDVTSSSVSSSVPEPPPQNLEAWAVRGLAEGRDQGPGIDAGAMWVRRRAAPAARTMVAGARSDPRPRCVRGAVV